jgi:NitT/TauT family transport system substrate-binding protein
MAHRIDRRTVLATAAAAGVTAALATPARVLAQALEKQEVTIAVGGKNLLYYLPLTIAEQLKYFEAEGLEVEIVDFAGGARALQAVVGGSADVVSGAFEHTLNMQFKGQPMRAFVLQGRAPQIVLAVSTKTMPNYKSLADLKGKKIGVTAPGSSTNIMANFVLAKAGLKPTDVSIVGVGASQGAVAAMRSGQIDAISNLDPVITILQRAGDIKIVSDTRDPSPRQRRCSADRCRPAACMRRSSFVEKNPNTAQALVNAIVRANKWIQQAGPSRRDQGGAGGLSARRPRRLHRRLPQGQGALSPDGIFPEAGSATALRALASVDPAMRAAKLDLKANYTNEFAKKANANPREAQVIRRGADRVMILGAVPTGTASRRRAHASPPAVSPSFARLERDRHDCRSPFARRHHLHVHLARRSLAALHGGARCAR